MEAIATGAAANASSEAAKGILLEVKRHLRYVIFNQKYVEKFEEKLKTLIAKRTSVQQVVDVAERNGEKIKADVLDWRNRVDKLIIEEEKEVNALEEKKKIKCFFGLCPSIKSRYRLSRRAEKDVITFDVLINECQFDHVGYRDVPEAIVHTNFETFKSREKLFNDIMESLKVSTTRMIGVYGMPGVGKTSLVKEVHRQLQEVKLFNSVIMTVVSPSPDVTKIQDQIAESLGLKLEESGLVRARRLCERLMNENKVLIILDDIWKELDLEEVGIPFGSQHKGCRILMTSRDKHVLCNVMGATETFVVGDLDEEEAWEFFKKMAGDCVESADVRPTAIEVANKCAGLPLAIATVARALRNKSVHAWRDALRQLQKPYSGNSREISAEVYSAIELSIKHLPSEDLKHTFLLCSLLRRNNRVEDLLRYAIGLGLINGVDTLEGGRDRLLTMLSTLKEACLLLDINTNDQFFGVHDLTYSVAKSIISKDVQVFALNQEDVLTDWPDEESLKKLNKICLEYPIINRLPDRLNCPQLSLFLLFSKDRSLTLSADFFKQATNLKVLDLTSMQFSSLPWSICRLTSLSTLCLDQCKLGDGITRIGELKSLEILSLIKSDIKILPKEIGKLVKLKLLDVSSCANLKIISAGVLSSLSRLEELYMGGTSIQWEQSRTTLADLHTLSRLSTLEVQIPDALTAPQDFFQELQKLERYKIFIGKEWEWFGNYQHSRTLKLRLSTGVYGLDRGIKKLLRKTEDLHLDDLRGVKIALQELTDEESLSNLKNLHIQNGLDIEYIIDDENEFPRLQSLTLQSLPQLISFCYQHETGGTSSLPQHELPLFSEKILLPCLEKLWLKSINVTRLWHNQLSTAYFRTYEKLTTLKIEGCGSLKHLFSFSMAKCLQHLTDLEIIGCNCLREVIFMEEIAEETEATMTLSLFPQLKSLELKYLPLLVGFCSFSRAQVIEFPAMMSLTIDNCPELESFICRSSMGGDRHISSGVLFDNKVAFPSLEVLCTEFLRKLKLIWQNPLPFPKLREISIMGLQNLDYIWRNESRGVFSFGNLGQVSVGNCWSLKHVFPASIARDLPQLSGLFIFDCGVEEIVSKVEEGSDSETTVTFKFDQLSSLVLWGLPECKCFYPGRHTTNWPMLKELQANQCGEMKIFDTQLGSPSPLFSVKTVIPKLQRLTLGAESVDFQISFLERFKNLEELCISEREIKELICTEGDTGNTGTYAGTLSTIRKLELRRLHNLKDHIWKQDIQVDHILPNLETLEVHNCENLVSLGSSSASFQNLATLKVWECKGMKYLDTCVAVQGLSQLKKLIIGECVSMKEIVASEEDEATCHIIFSRLKSLELVNLPRLKSFCSGNHTFGFPCLEEVMVSGCPQLEIFCKGILNAPLLQSVEYGEGEGQWSGDLESTVRQLHSTKVWYQDIGCFVLSDLSESIEIWKERRLDLRNLEVLEVEECNSLEYIFSVSMALELVRLTDLKVKNCRTVEYIIKKGAEETAMDTIWLPKLGTIKLESCSELTSFYMGSVTLECPYLRTLEIDDCPKMYAMTSVGGGEKTPFFNDKVLCANLQVLMVKGCHNFEYLFSSSLIKNFVEFLGLSVVDCENIKEVIFINESSPSSSSSSAAAAAAEGITETFVFTKLVGLVLSGLPKLRTFCHGGNSETDTPTLFNEKVVFPSLNRLRIQGLEKCGKIWHDEATMDSFCELTHLWVLECARLLNIFPLYMVERLEKLHTLEIWGCESLEEVIGADDDDDRLHSTESLKSTPKFVFPKVQSLTLVVLPKLKGFYSKLHTMEWPSLEKIMVGECSKVETFAGEYINFQETQAQSQPLFWVTQETFPSLQVLFLIRNGNIKEIWHGALPNPYFFSLTSLLLTDFPETSGTNPNCFIQSLPNLEKLSVERFALNGLFPSKGLGDEDEQAGTVDNLTELRFSELSLAEVFCNLEILQALGCDKLKNLVPSSVSFKHLTTLQVSQCHGFRNLVTFTTAKSMVQLTRMTVTDCQMLEEIIASTTDEVTDGIVFSQLKSLELDGLSTLSSFCSGKYTLVFPSLEEVTIKQCPKIKFFTKGKLSTPMLHGLRSTEEEYIGRWEGDLNVTLQQLFVEKKLREKRTVLFKLKSFSQRIHTTGRPSLKK
ncbi:hypothetical protein V6N12_034922 [Hibiscus sabdariffa]|uniref:AAA+ ATPase domain-containing protein n=1 Tax=Hibiscus sabdariffa TaxID=183260 RepID=A0ABR2BP05_9ROSI